MFGQAATARAATAPDVAVYKLRAPTVRAGVAGPAGTVVAGTVVVVTTGEVRGTVVVEGGVNVGVPGGDAGTVVVGVPGAVGVVVIVGVDPPVDPPLPPLPPPPLPPPTVVVGAVTMLPTVNVNASTNVSSWVCDVENLTTTSTTVCLLMNGTAGESTSSVVPLLAAV